MKVTLIMAMSVDGFIARKNGSEDFLSDKNWLLFANLAKKTGCFIVGRKTYEAVSAWPDYDFSDIKATCIVVSKKTLLRAPGCLVARSPREALAVAEKQGFKEVLLSGGSNLNAAFLKQGLIDEAILNIESVLVGDGIPLFAKGVSARLQLRSSKRISQAITQMRFRVEK